MRLHPRRTSSRTAVVALALTAVILSACTPSGAPSASRARANEPVDEALAEEIAEQQEVADERTEALEAAAAAGTVGIVGTIRRDPSPGWAGERIVNRTGNDWEPSIAADPNAPYVYILHNRYGGEDACAKGCPDPAMILHVSDDGGATWQPERFLCRCKGVRAQYDPLIEVVPGTGDVVAVWMNGFKIQFARSTDHGATWTEPTWIHPDVKWGDKPNLAISDDGQDVYVQFNGPTGGDAYSAASHDGGLTWSTTKITDSDRYYFDYGGAVLPNGVVVFAQISFSYTGPHNAAEGVQRIHVFTSHDDGGTWSEQVVDELELGRECTSRSCYGDFYDSGPALAADQNGDLVIVYNGASQHFGPQTVYARSSKDGGVTWSDRVQLSRDGANAAFPAAVGEGNDGVRVWFMAQRNRRWQVWYRTTVDLGATWSPREKLSDATSGTVYKHPGGFDEVYGDYGEIAITSDGHTIGVWGEGKSYYGPGGVWFNRQT
jgi:BNR repeat-like domain